MGAASALQLSSVRNLQQGFLDPILDIREERRKEERGLANLLERDQRLGLQQQSNALALAGINNQATIDRLGLQQEFQREQEDRELLDKIQGIPDFQLPTDEDLTPGKLSSRFRGQAKEVLRQRGIELESEKEARDLEFRLTEERGLVGVRTKAEKDQQQAELRREFAQFPELSAKLPSTGDVPPALIQELRNTQRVKGHSVQREQNAVQQFDSIVALAPSQLGGKVSPDRVASDPITAKNELLQQHVQPFVDAESAKIQAAIDQAIERSGVQADEARRVFAQVMSQMREEAIASAGGDLVGGFAPDPKQVSLRVQGALGASLPPEVQKFFAGQLATDLARLAMIRERTGVSPGAAITTGFEDDDVLATPEELAAIKRGLVNDPQAIEKFAAGKNLSKEQIVDLRGLIGSAPEVDERFQLTQTEESIGRVREFIGSDVPSTANLDDPTIGLFDATTGLFKSDFNIEAEKVGFEQKSNLAIQNLEERASAAITEAAKLTGELRTQALFQIQQRAVKELQATENLLMSDLIGRGSPVSGSAVFFDPLTSSNAELTPVAREFLERLQEQIDLAKGDQAAEETVDLGLQN